MESKKELTAREACDIMKVCQQSGVGKISFRGLIVSFEGGRPHWRDEAFRAGEVIQADHVDEKTTEQEEFAAKDQQAAEFVITDPMQYEELLADGEFTDERSGTEQGSGRADSDD